MDASGKASYQQSSSDNHLSGNILDPGAGYSAHNNPVSQSSQMTETGPINPIGSLKDYDPLWVQKDNVDPKIVEVFASRIKFDTLFTQEVLKIGDVLTFQVSAPSTGGGSVRTEAHLTVTGSSTCVNNKKGGRFPDFSITVVNDPSRQHPDVKACLGTGVIVDHLQRVCGVSAVEDKWRAIQVIRGQQHLGSLWWVKQAFNTWRDLKDQESQRTGQKFRRRRQARGKGNEGGAGCLRGTFGLLRDGVFQPDPDQGRYHVGG